MVPRLEAHSLMEGAVASRPTRQRPSLVAKRSHSTTDPQWVTPTFHPLLCMPESPTTLCSPAPVRLTSTRSNRWVLDQHQSEAFQYRNIPPWRQVVQNNNSKVIFNFNCPENNLFNCFFWIDSTVVCGSFLISNSFMFELNSSPNLQIMPKKMWKTSVEKNCIFRVGVRIYWLLFRPVQISLKTKVLW